MSSSTEPPQIPDHWAHTPPAPRETRYLCTLDGTTIEGAAARRAHDAHFHAEDGPEQPQPGGIAEEALRREALQAAVATQRGAEHGEQIIKRAEALLAFLRGADPRPDSVAPGALHEALDRAWASMHEEAGAWVGDDDDDGEDVLEQMRALTDSDLIRGSFALSIVRGLGRTVHGERRGSDA